MKRRRVRKRAEEIGREEGHDEVRQGPSALCLSVKRKQKERRERDVKEERQQGGHFIFLEGC